SSMLQFIAIRLIQSIPLVIGATMVIFVMMRLIPGDPAQILVGPDAPAEAVEAARRQLGLDRSWPEQYVIWIGNLLRGDLGFSYFSRIPVTELLMLRLPATLQLMVAGMLLTVIIAIPAGTIAAVRSGTAADWIITSAAGISIGVPGFWVGILSLLLFA